MGEDNSFNKFRLRVFVGDRRRRGGAKLELRGAIISIIVLTPTPAITTAQLEVEGLEGKREGSRKGESPSASSTSIGGREGREFRVSLAPAQALADLSTATNFVSRAYIDILLLLLMINN